MPYIPSDNIFGVQATKFYKIEEIFALCGYVSEQNYKVADLVASPGGTPVYALASDPNENPALSITYAADRPVTITGKYYYRANASSEFPDTPSGTVTIYVDTTYEYNGQTVYWAQPANFYLNGSYRNTRYVYPGDMDPANISNTTVRRQYAWLMIYGGYYDGYNVVYNLTGCTGDPDNPILIRPNAVMTNAYFTPDQYKYFQADSVRIVGYGSGGGEVTFVFEYEEGHLKIGPVESDITVIVTAQVDPYAEGGNTDSGGGTGDYDDVSIPVDFADLPTISAASTGFITLYNPSLSQLNNLASYLWSSAFDLDNLVKLFADPMEAILGLSIVPGPVPNGGGYSVKIGNIDSGITMTKAASQYVDFNCGSLNVSEFWGAYLDYEPYTKAEIYLPFIGTHQLAIDDIMNKTMAIKYHIDLLSGACVAEIKCGDSVLYTFNGSCSVSIPVTGRDFTNVINGVLTIAGSIGSMVATGGAAAPSAVGEIASAAVNSLKPSIEKSGAISGAGGLLAGKRPVLILTRPRQALPVNQKHYTGYPSFMTENLGSISGYTEVHSIRLSGIDATESELDEIEELLKGGVIL